MAPARTPVTLLTGHLGVGKTTLLRRLLDQGGAERMGVLVNEVGDIGLDGERVRAGAAELVERAGGCLCCQPLGAWGAGLAALAAARPPLDRLIIETTGLADPAPLLHQLWQRPGPGEAWRVDGVLTLVDAFAWSTQRAAGPEWLQQVRLADHLHISRLDALPAAERPAAEASLRALLRAEAPLATVSVGHPAAVDARALIDAARARPGLRPHRPAAAQHASALRSHSLRVPGWLDPLRLDALLHRLSVDPGARLLRAKGVFAVEGAPARLELHGVAGRWSGAPGPDWAPGEPIESRSVWIGAELPIEAIAAGLEACRVSA